MAYRKKARTRRYGSPRPAARRRYGGRGASRSRGVRGRSVRGGSQTVRIVVEHSTPQPAAFNPGAGNVVPVVPGKKAKF